MIVFLNYNKTFSPYNCQMLIKNLSFLYIFFWLVTTIHARSDVELTDTASPCYTLINGTHRIGCRTGKDGSNGVILFINDESEINKLEKLSLNGKVISENFIFVVDMKYLTKNFVQKLISSEIVTGVIFYSKNIQDFSFSEDAECPNKEFSYYQTDMDHGCHWNSNSALHPGGLRFLDWKKPVFFLTNQTELDILYKTYKKFNSPPSNLEQIWKPLAFVNLGLPTENVKNTIQCKRLVDSYFQNFWGYGSPGVCESLIDYNIFVSLPFFNKEVENIKTFILSTRIDSFSTFPNASFGDTSVLTSLITNIAVAEALGEKLTQIEELLLEKKKQILFTFFHGESFGYIGSSRFIYDVKKANFRKGKNVRKMNLKDISMYVETNMLLPYDSNVYLNHMQKIYYDKNVLEAHGEKINKFANIYKKKMKSEGYEVKNTGPSPKIPPSSYYSFLKENSSTPGFVILPAEVSYYNDKLNTISDVNIRTNKKLRNKTIETLTAVSKSLLTIVLEFSEATKYSDTIKINETYISILVDCFFYSSKDICPYFDEFLRQDGAEYKHFHKVVSPFIYPNSNSNLRDIIWLILLREVSIHTPYSVIKSNCSEKNSNDDDPYTYSWQYSHEIGNYHCFKSPVFASTAESPAFDIEDYDFTTTNYSTWAESVRKDPFIKVYLDYGKTYDLCLVMDTNDLPTVEDCDERKAKNRLKQATKYNFNDLVGGVIDKAKEEFRSSKLADDVLNPTFEEEDDDYEEKFNEKNELKDEEDVTTSLDNENNIEKDSKITYPPDIPLSMEATIKNGSYSITTITFDNHGTKFITGDLNCEVKMYDFTKMDTCLQSERTITPCERHIINNISTSNNGEYTLICSTNAVIYIIDRNGSIFGETARGDMYLVDIKQTKAHTTSVNYCCWNPLIKEEFLTCSSDGTLRIWSMEDWKELSKCINKQRQVIKIKTTSNNKVIPNVCAYSKNGKLIAAGCEDGGIFIWKNGKVFVSPNYSNKSAHSDCITSLDFSPDSSKIITRSKDGTLKLWSVNKLAKPEGIIENLQNDQQFIDCGFSPHGNYIFTLCSESQRVTKQLPKDPTRVQWHPKINQILIGFTDGSLTIFYDVNISIKGILESLTRKVKKPSKNAVVQSEIILAPLTLDYFQPRNEDDEEKELTEWRIKKALKLGTNIKKPTFITANYDPQSVSNKSGGTLHSYLARNMGMDRNKELRQNDDIRGSILKHAEAAAKNPIFTGPAYSKTQPKTILQKSHEEEDDHVVPTKVKKYGE
uniref:WD_REPEATS_REGION domain-containing protein n=1 Tax=Strongyloides stercoralis TaxID=6248 RepID=A0A0K0ERH9_STRER